MAITVKPPRKLLLITATLLLAVSSVSFFTKHKLPPSIPINTAGQPTLGYGKARVHVVVFEEPKCSHCRDFNNEIFPKIKKEFIDTNKIRYTVIPISFLPGSMPAAIASLSVYHDRSIYPNDELFFKYVDYMYQHEKNVTSDWATTNRLVEFAKATSPAIELHHLEEDIEKQTFRLQIENNTAYGAYIMGGTISAPAVYVNGIKLDELSYDSLTTLIKEVLEHEGVY